MEEEHHHHHSHSHHHSHHSHQYHHHWHVNYARLLQIMLHNLFAFVSRIPYLLAWVLVGVYPAIYFGGEIWWAPLALLTILLGYSCWAFSAWWRAKGSCQLHISPMSLVFLIPLSWGGLQACSCGSFLLSILSPKAHQIVSNFNCLGLGAARNCISLSPEMTFEKMGIVLICLMLFWLLSNRCSHKIAMRLIMWAVVLGSFINALLSFMQTFSHDVGGINSIAPFSGTFMNRNHFGFMMIAGIFAAVGLLVFNTCHREVSKRAMRGDGRRYRTLRSVLLMLAIFIEVSALVMSQSRGAFIGLAVSTILFFIGWVVLEHKNMRHKGRQMLLAALAMTFCALIMALPYAMEKLSDRYKQLLEGELSMDDRAQLWVISAGYIKDFWLTGSGIGSYSDIIQHYDTKGRFPVNKIDHAHNDYVEFLAECGLPVGLSTIMLFFVLLGVAARRIWKSDDSCYKWCGWGAFSAIVGCMVHELTDFNLQAWSNAVAITALLSVVVAASAPKAEDEEKSSLNKEKIRSGRFGSRLPLAVVGVCLLICAMFEYFHFKGACSLSRLYALNRAITQWQPGTKDCVARIVMAKHAWRHVSEKRIFEQIAIWLAEYSRLGGKGSNIMFNKACKYAACAMRREPGNGDFALKCAEIFKMANRHYSRHDSDASQLELFKWVGVCNPGVPDMVRRVAVEACSYYARARLLYPDEKDEARVEALSLLTKAMALEIDKSVQYMQYLVEVAENDEQLMEFCAGSFDMRIALVRHFIWKKNYEKALFVLDELFHDNENLADEQVHGRLYSMLEARALIYELTGEPVKRKADALHMLSLCRKNKLEALQEKIDELEKLPQSGELKALESNSSTIPFTFEEFLIKGKLYHTLGNNADSLHALVGLAYNEAPLPLAMIMEAQEILITAPTAYVHESEVVRAQFLQAAFMVMQGENGNKEVLVPAVSMLSAMQEKYDSSIWLQFHLIPYYEGRAYECMKNPQKAVEAYRRALTISPTNLFVLRKLAALTSDGFSPAELEILRFAKLRLDPICTITAGLKWLACEASPEQVAAIHSEIGWKIMMLCTGDIKTESDLNFVFSDETGFCMAQEVSWKQSTTPMLSWRVGEVYDMTFKWQPHLLCLKTNIRTMTPGKVTVQMSARMLEQEIEPVPQPVCHAWSVAK